MNACACGEPVTACPHCSAKRCLACDPDDGPACIVPDPDCGCIEDHDFLCWLCHHIGSPDEFERLPLDDGTYYRCRGGCESMGSGTPTIGERKWAD